MAALSAVVAPNMLGACVFLLTGQRPKKEDIKRPPLNQEGALKKVLPKIKKERMKEKIRKRVQREELKKKLFY